MTKRDFYSCLKTMKCDLCGTNEYSQHMSTITISDIAEKIKIRVCQKCSEKITDKFYEIATSNKGVK